MNRPLEFRVWTGTKMEYNIVAGRDGVFYAKIHPRDSACLEPTSRYELDTPVMQFTGLRDSFGGKIFEGDIILDEWEQDDPFSDTPDVPRHEHKIFEVKYIEGCFNLKKDPIKHRCSYNFKRKVVGNIFENKDLLPIPVHIKETLNDEEFSTSEMIDLLLNKV